MMEAQDVKTFTEGNSLTEKPLLSHINQSGHDPLQVRSKSYPGPEETDLEGSLLPKGVTYYREDLVEVAKENDPLVESFNEDFIDRQADPVEEGGVLCEVCYSNYKLGDFFALQCGHSFCVNCQSDHLKTKISNGQALKLPCMQQGCKEKYSLEQIQMFCSAKIVKTYNVIKEDVRVGKSNKLKWCARPGCERTIRRPGCCCKRRSICECGFETCFKCGDPMHEAACQVSGETGLLMHNINPRVSKCPKCRVPIYKTSGCNHMTCDRCNTEWCWICRQYIHGYDHFGPQAIFGCFFQVVIPQSIILWILCLSLHILVSPFTVLCAMCFKIGGCIGRSGVFGGRISQDESMLGVIFWIGILGVPFALVPTLIVLPAVILYRLYVLLSVIFRHFICCCCC